jgi:hypothetical protein
MANDPHLDREEHIEQAYFFRVFRERLAEAMSAQEVLERAHEEILATTRLPLAVQFMATEIKHSGLISSGFARLPHYFTAFQTFIVQRTEEEGLRFPLEIALLVLQREAEYRAGQPTPSGLFTFQFEVLCRNRLGYEDGLKAMASNPFYSSDWQAFLTTLRRQLGVVDFEEIVFLRSELYVQEQQRRDAGYEPPLPPLFGEREGRIARANRGRDPLLFFAALQRQLGYPEVPRPKPRDDMAIKLELIQNKLRDLEQRIKLIEGELRGQIDLSQFGKPELLSGGPEVELD